MSGILRPINPKHVGRGQPPDAHEHLLGPSAVERVNDIERCRVPPQNVIEIWKLTAEEIRDGIAEPLATRDELDERFGVGNWRPLKRHVIWQNGKWRPIDDGRRSRTNALSNIAETVVCIPPEFLLLTLRYLALALIRSVGELPPWFHPVVSLQDWWKGRIPSLRPNPLLFLLLLLFLPSRHSPSSSRIPPALPSRRPSRPCRHRGRPSSHLLAPSRSEEE